MTQWSQYIQKCHTYSPAIILFIYMNEKRKRGKDYTRLLIKAQKQAIISPIHPQLPSEVITVACKNFPAATNNSIFVSSLKT